MRGQLIVKASEHPALRAGVVVLNEAGFDASQLFEGVVIPTLEEEPSLVLEPARLENQDIAQRRRTYLHQPTRYRLPFMNRSKPAATNLNQD
jgi:hypothetical protein